MKKAISVLLCLAIASQFTVSVLASSLESSSLGSTPDSIVTDSVAEQAVPPISSETLPEVEQSIPEELNPEQVTTPSEEAPGLPDVGNIENQEVPQPKQSNEEDIDLQATEVNTSSNAVHEIKSAKTQPTSVLKPGGHIDLELDLINNGSKIKSIFLNYKLSLHNSYSRNLSTSWTNPDTDTNTLPTGKHTLSFPIQTYSTVSGTYEPVYIIITDDSNLTRSYGLTDKTGILAELVTRTSLDATQADIKILPNDDRQDKNAPKLNSIKVNTAEVSNSTPLNTKINYTETGSGLSEIALIYEITPVAGPAKYEIFQTSFEGLFAGTSLDIDKDFQGFAGFVHNAGTAKLVYVFVVDKDNNFSIYAETEDNRPQNTLKNVTEGIENAEYLNIENSSFKIKDTTAPFLSHVSAARKTVYSPGWILLNINTYDNCNLISKVKINYSCPNAGEFVLERTSNPETEPSISSQFGLALKVPESVAPGLYKINKFEIWDISGNSRVYTLNADGFLADESNANNIGISVSESAVNILNNPPTSNSVPTISSVSIIETSVPELGNLTVNMNIQGTIPDECIARLLYANADNTYYFSFETEAGKLKEGDNELSLKLSGYVPKGDYSLSQITIGSDYDDSRALYVPHPKGSNTFYEYILSDQYLGYNNLNIQNTTLSVVKNTSLLDKPSFEGKISVLNSPLDAPGNIKMRFTIPDNSESVKGFFFKYESQNPNGRKYEKYFGMDSYEESEYIGPGTHTLDFEIDNNIKPGEYKMVEAAVSDKYNRQTIYLINEEGKLLERETQQELDASEASFIINNVSNPGDLDPISILAIKHHEGPNVDGNTQTITAPNKFQLDVLIEETGSGIRVINFNYVANTALGSNKVYNYSWYIGSQTPTTPEGGKWYTIDLPVDMYALKGTYRLNSISATDRYINTSYYQSSTGVWDVNHDWTLTENVTKQTLDIKNTQLKVENNLSIAGSTWISNANTLKLIKDMPADGTMLIDAGYGSVLPASWLKAIADTDKTIVVLYNGIQTVFKGRINGVANIKEEDCKDIYISPEINGFEGYSLGFPEEESVDVLNYNPLNGQDETVQSFPWKVTIRSNSRITRDDNFILSKYTKIGSQAIPLDIPITKDKSGYIEFTTNELGRYVFSKTQSENMDNKYRPYKYNYEIALDEEVQIYFMYNYSHWDFTEVLEWTNPNPSAFEIDVETNIIKAIAKSGTAEFSVKMPNDQVIKINLKIKENKPPVTSSSSNPVSSSSTAPSQTQPVVSSAPSSSSSSSQQPPKPAPKVTQVKFAQNAITLLECKSITIKAMAYTDDGKAAKVEYKSSNTKIATVNSSGKITAKKAGKAKITAAAENGKKAVINVTVLKKGTKTTKVTKVTANVPKKLKLKKTAYVTPKIYPSKASGIKVTYSSSKKAIASIDAYGKITAKKKGVTVITVKAGGKTQKYNLKVV